MPRCSSCNKFASLEECEPEVSDVSVDDEGHVTAQVRIANACQDCGTELTEANLELEADCPEAAKHVQRKGDHTLEAEEESSERDVRTEGKGRYAKTFYGAKITVKVTCSCEKFSDCTVELVGHEQASAMDLLE